jgi:type IV pilus assembly protein PilQ
VRSVGKRFSGELIDQNPQATILKGTDGVSIKFRVDQIDWNQTTQAIREEERATPRYLPVPRTKHEPEERIARTEKWTGERYTFDFKEIDIRDFFRFMADVSGLNVIVDPGVKGSVTMKLTDVPWDQALDLVAKNEGLAYTIEGNVIRIAPYTKIVQELRARADAEREKMLSGEMITITKRLSYAKASAMQNIVKRLLTPKGSVIIDARTNTLIITDVSGNMDQVMGTLSGLD